MNDKTIIAFKEALRRSASESITKSDLELMTTDVSEYISGNGIINIDADDLVSVMEQAGSTQICTGTGQGKNGPQDASNMVLGNDSFVQFLKIADAAVISVTISSSMGLAEVEAAMTPVQSRVHDECIVLFAARFDFALTDEICIRVLAIKR